LTGISEILVLVLLIVCILILPRIFKGEPEKKPSLSKKVTRLSAKIRFGIVMSFLYPFVAGIYLKPWNKNITSFLSFGILPVFLGWGIAWVLAGRKQTK
jgi:predicted Na+-dependent transporter